MNVPLSRRHPTYGRLFPNMSAGAERRYVEKSYVIYEKSLNIEFTYRTLHKRAGYDLGWIFKVEYSILEIIVFFLLDRLPNRWWRAQGNIISKWLFGDNRWPIQNKRKKRKETCCQWYELRNLKILFGTIYQPLRSGRIWHKVSF